MSAIADLVAHLVSTGIPPEAIARAVDLAQQHVKESVEIHRNSTGIPPDTAAEKRRAYDRERKRKPANDALTTLLPSSSDSQGKKEGVVGRARGARLPPDWRPTNADACFALPLIGERRMAEEAEKFRDYWHARAGPGGVKLDWEATWRTWIRKAVADGKRNGKPAPIADAFAELRLELDGAGDGGQGGAPMRDVTPGRAGAG
jgi:hypothetical protein